MWFRRKHTVANTIPSDFQSPNDSRLRTSGVWPRFFLMLKIASHITCLHSQVSDWRPKRWLGMHAKRHLADTAPSLALEPPGSALSSRFLHNVPSLGFPSFLLGTSDCCAESPTPLLDLVHTQLLSGSLIHLLSLVVLFDPLAPLSGFYHWIAFTSSWEVPMSHHAPLTYSNIEVTRVLWGRHPPLCHPIPYLG